MAAKAEGPAAVEEIFADLSGKPQVAAQKVLHFLKNQGDAKQLIDAARVLVFLKGSNAHDYKYSSAILEDYYNVSPGLARPLPGRRRVLVEGLRRRRQPPRPANADGAGVMQGADGS